MKPNSTQPGQKTCTWSRCRSRGRAQHMCTPTLLLHVVPRWHRDNRSKGRGWQRNLSPVLLLMALLDRLHSSARSMFVQCYFITLLCPLSQFRQTFIFSSHRKNCCWKRICAAKKTKDLQINETLTAVWLVLFYFVYAQDQWQQADSPRPPKHPLCRMLEAAACHWELPGGSLVLEKQSVCGCFPGLLITDTRPPSTDMKRCLYKQEQTDKHGNRESSHSETFSQFGLVRLGRATNWHIGNFNDRQLFSAIGKYKYKFLEFFSLDTNKRLYAEKHYRDRDQRSIFVSMSWHPWLWWDKYISIW